MRGNHRPGYRWKLGGHFPILCGGVLVPSPPEPGPHFLFSPNVWRPEPCRAPTYNGSALATGRRPAASERHGVFISVDMEGMAGIVHLQQVIRGMPEYERSCKLMTAETNAAVAGARRAAAPRVVG